MGDAIAHVQYAFTQIQTRIGNIKAASSLYQTAPWGNTNQQNFVNQVLQVDTNLSAQDVLQTLLDIEVQMGRSRNLKWEPRIIDIDLLFYGSEIIQSENLIVPHPLLHQRRFTLIPLAQIAPNFIHPTFNSSVAQLLASCEDTSEVIKIETE